MRLLAPLSWLLGADAHAGYMASTHCDRALTVGTRIMCCDVQQATDRTVEFRRNGAPLACGSGSYVSGETLTAHISSTSGQYVMEVGGGSMPGGGCTGNVRRSGVNGADVQAPTDGSTLSLVAAWATLSWGQVKVTAPCTLSAATTAAPTTNTVTTNTVTATTVTSTTVTSTTLTSATTATETTASTQTMTSTTALMTAPPTTAATAAPTTAGPTTAPLTPPPFVEGEAYASVGGAGVVAADEGLTAGAYREDCSADPGDTCFQATPTLAFCEQECTGNAACDSFAYCTGNSGAPFPRCYLKTRRIDFETKEHADCTTFKADGAPLAADLHVARTEGATLASFKEDCTDDASDTCHRTALNFSTCLDACAQQDGCASFAYCTGVNNSGTDLQRCYLKTGNFSTVAHGAGDCASYYPRGAAMCSHLQGHYLTQECCGMPHKELDMNQARAGGVQPF